MILYLRFSKETNFLKMKNKILNLTLFMLLAVLTSCVKNEFTVDFELPQNVNSNYRLLYYASDPEKGWYSENVAPVQKGVYKFTGFTHYPTVVFVFKDSSQPLAAFYAERGDDIKIQGDNPDPSAWIISGNRLTEEWNAWTRENRDILASKSPSKINSAVEKYVKSHKNSDLSAILLSLYYDRRSDGSQFAGLWGTLDFSRLDAHVVDLVQSADIITGGPVVPVSLRGLRLHTAGRGDDSIAFAKSAGTMLYFWRSGDDKKDDALQMIRNLIRDFPDSASRQVVDICMENDSLAWMTPVRQDSLAHSVRAWMPLGEADEKAITLGVERTPWFIVLGRNGKPSYQGQDVSKADKAYRSLMKKLKK